ncbi:LAMI_0C04786g1_1 [Lachancea mirantina]|uniref:LAMI_0C04786g1_1 n=1 Tax=Lachancea mirantina TaxID=1230905 RepID=A0A1G4J2A3_9SACH|nr:LAMI_0C04786g1_1 [Lachancea mirantina]
MPSLKVPSVRARTAIPDLRFEQTFMNAVRKEAIARHGITAKTQDSSDGKVKITAGVVCKVILRDVFLMPFVQGILWTSVLIAMRPWLSNATRSGQRLGRYIYRTILGKDLVPKRA